MSSASPGCRGTVSLAVRCPRQGLVRAVGFDAKCLRDKCEADNQGYAARSDGADGHLVRRARRELADVATLELIPVAGKPPSFPAGPVQHAYAFGIGGVAISMSRPVMTANKWPHAWRFRSRRPASVPGSTTGRGLFPGGLAKA